MQSAQYNKAFFASSSFWNVVSICSTYYYREFNIEVIYNNASNVFVYQENFQSSIIYLNFNLICFFSKWMFSTETSSMVLVTDILLLLQLIQYRKMCYIFLFPKAIPNSYLVRFAVNNINKHILILIILNSDFDVYVLFFNPYPWRYLDARLKWTNSYAL